MNKHHLRRPRAGLASSAADQIEPALFKIV
jgi:hypothetical protein